MSVSAHKQRSRQPLDALCLSVRRSSRPARWCRTWCWLLLGLAACVAQAPKNCSSTCAATATLHRAGSGQVTVTCSPGSLQQVLGLVLHPLLLDLPGSYQGATWLRQRWQQAGRPPALVSVSGTCLRLQLKRSRFGGLDMGRLNLTALVAVSSGAHLDVEGLECVGVKGGTCISAVGAGQVTLRALNISGVQAAGGTSPVQVSNCTSVYLSSSTFSRNRGGRAGAAFLEGLQAVQVQGSSWQDNVGMGINRDGGAGALAIRRAGSVVLSSSVFTNNTAERASGGAVSCVQCGQQVFRGLTFTGNTALRGSGGALHQNSSSSSTQLQRVVFEANRASANGGGLATYGMNATSCTAYIPECHTLLEGCAFIGNKAGVGQFTAGGGGGGMYAEQLTSTWRAIIVANSTFVNNSAASQSMSSVQSMDVDSSGAGGAIGESGQQNIATFVYNTTFERNTAAYGGAITLIWGGGLLCRNCTFRYNSAWSHGGAVMVYRVATSAAINMLDPLRKALPMLPDPWDAVVGGAFQPTSNSTTLDEQYLLSPGALTIQACRFEHNAANVTGGDIHAWIPQQNLVVVGSTLHNSSAGLRGGSISLIGGIFIGVGSVFSDCTAGLGGGGAVHVDGADAASLITVYGAWSMFVEIVRSAFINNSAKGPGGAVFATGITFVNLANSLVEGNRAGAGPGGGLAVSGVQLLQVKGSVVRNNQALAGAGGGAACSSCASLLVANSTLCGNRALQGGGLDNQGSPSIPSWAAIVNSTISGNAAILPSSAPPSRNTLSLGHSGGDTTLPASAATAAPADSQSLTLSTPATMLASEQGVDEYRALFGVGGGLRLVAASLLATNSSFKGNSAARLGQQAALVQACWRDAARKETLPGSYNLMEVYGGAKCSFAHLASSVEFETAPCKKDALGSDADSSSSSGGGGSRGMRSCPDLMPHSLCDPDERLQDCSADVDPEAAMGASAGFTSRSAPVFTAVAVLPDGDRVQQSPVAPYMNNCTINFTSMGDSLQLDTKRECEVGSTTWGAGCECLQGWVYTTFDAQENGPYSTCQNLDWAVPWCVINITTCTSTPCGTWDSCRTKGDTRTLPSRPPFELVADGTCQRSWQVPDSLAGGVVVAAHPVQDAEVALSSSSSAGCSGSSPQAEGLPLVAATTSPAQVLLLPDALDVLVHQPGQGQQLDTPDAAPAAVADYQPYSGWVPPACRPQPSAVAGAADWGAYPTLRVTTIASNTLPPLVLLAADAAGNPVLPQQTPAAIPARMMVTVQLVVGGDVRAGNSSSSSSSSSSSPAAAPAGQDEVLSSNVGDNGRASVSGLSSAVYATTPDLLQQLVPSGESGDSASPGDASSRGGVQLSQLLHVKLPALQLHAGPGRYWLRFTDTSLPLSLPPPAAACLMVDVLPCGLGEVSGASTVRNATAGSAGATTRPGDSSSSSSSSGAFTDRGVGLAASAGCSPCEAGTFSLVPRATTCQPCLEGGECPGGSALRSADGWWHPSPLATTLVPCLHPSACIAEDDRRQLVRQQSAVAAVQLYAAVGRENGNARVGNRRLQQATSSGSAGGGSEQPWDAAAYWSSQCAEGHSGPLCGSCSRGWVPHAGQACSRCSQQCWLLVLLQVLSFLLLLGLMLLAAQRVWVCGLHQRTASEPQVMQVATLWLQLLGLLPLLRTPWPRAVEGVLLLVSSIIYGSTGFGANGLSLDCLVDRLLLPKGTALTPGQLPPAAIRLVFKVLVLPLLTTIAAVLAQAAGSALWHWAAQRRQRRLPAHLLHPSLSQLQRSWAKDKSVAVASHSNSFSGSRPPCETAPAPQLSVQAGHTFLGLPWARVVVLVLVVLQVQYPGVLYAALSTFNCVSVPLPRLDPSTSLRLLAAAGNTTAVSSSSRGSSNGLAAVWRDAWGMAPVRLWVMDMGRTCYNGYHMYVLLPASLVGLVVWGVGLPAALLVLGIKACRAAKAGKAAKPHTPHPPGNGSAGEVPFDSACHNGGQQHPGTADQHPAHRQDSSGGIPSAHSRPNGSHSTVRLSPDSDLAAGDQRAAAAAAAAQQHSAVLFVPSGHSGASLHAKDIQELLGGGVQSREMPVEGVGQVASGARPLSGTSHWAGVVTSCLAASYRPAALWWPAAQLLLLFVLVATTVFASQAGAAMQPAFMLLPLAVMYVSLQAYQPHQSGVQGVLTMLVVGVAGLLLFCAVALGICSSSIPGRDGLRQQQLCTLPPSPAAAATLVWVLILVPLLAMAHAARRVLWYWGCECCRWLRTRRLCCEPLGMARNR